MATTDTERSRLADPERFLLHGLVLRGPILVTVLERTTLQVALLVD